MDGPKRPGVESAKGCEIPLGRNFRKEHYPYWHNSHHLIPKKLLAQMLKEAGGEISNIMISALLSVKYNMHGEPNMLILPQGEKIAKILGLPRHLQLKTPAPGKDGDCFDHSDYTDAVETRLDKIIQKYQELAEEANVEKCAARPKKFKLDKKKLNKLSNDCFKTILKFAETNAGASIDEITEITDYKEKK